MARIFDDHGVCRIAQVAQELEEESKSIFRDYLLFIQEHELGYYCSEEELALFPELPDEFLFPAQISNAILDTDSRFEYLNEGILEQLAFLGCHFIQLRCYNVIPFTDLQVILDLIAMSSIKSFELVLPYDKMNSGFYFQIKRLIGENKKISCIIISGADKDECLAHDDLALGMIFKTNKIIDSEVHCGLIARELFSINIPTYTESLHYNSCLNRKMAIDIKGNIKNCPSMSHSYGNIADTTLLEALRQKGFRQYWNITKDQVSKCKDCEFRHVCTDCRAYLDNPEDAYSAPLKCGYDPYSCTWEEWSANPLKQEAIDFYQMNF